MKNILVAVGLALLLSIDGCASMFSAKTTARYQITPDGKIISYESTKEQQGLDMELTEEEGAVKTVKIHVDKATTAEAAIAAALQVQVELLKVLETIAPIAATAAKTGGS